MSHSNSNHLNHHKVADENGFRANIKTNEPGVKTHQAADANYQAENWMKWKNSFKYNSFKY